MTMVSKPRGEYAKTAERREEILEAAVQVFAQGGFRHGSLREVAERVGMSQAGLLHHFANKNELLEAVLDRRDNDARARMQIDPVNGSQPEGLDLIRALVDLVAYNASTPGLVALFTVLSAEATAPDHPAHAYFTGRYAWVGEVVSEAFQVAQERGELREGVDPRSATRTLVALVDGLQVQWLFDPSIDMSTDVRNYVQGLLTTDLGAETL